jgi:drug/metabolite transporter (DMT)-like permease
LDSLSIKCKNSGDVTSSGEPIEDLRNFEYFLFLLITFIYTCKGVYYMGQNKNTTIAGIGAILVAVGALLTAWFDGDAATNPDFASAIAAVIAGVGLILAKDASNNTTPPAA